VRDVRGENTGGPSRIETKPSTVLFYTAWGGPYGMGHLRRCLSIIRAGRGVFDAVVYRARGGGAPERAPDGRSRGVPGVRFVDDLGEVSGADLVVADVRETGREEMKRLWRIAPVLSIDDLKAGSSFSHVSIRTPSGEGHRGAGAEPRAESWAEPRAEPWANFGGFSYVVLGEGASGRRRTPFGRKEGILISFGGSDPGNLSYPVASLLLSAGLNPTVVRGPFFTRDPGGLPCEVVEAPADLPGLVDRSGVLITSYGITMFEAFALGTPVILVNRSKYHSSLARALPLINLGVWGSGSRGAPSREVLPHRAPSHRALGESLLGCLADRKTLENNARAARGLVDGRGAERVARVIEDALGGLRRDCLFGHGNAGALLRSRDRTVFRCRRCGDLFMYETRPRTPGYDSEEYFVSEYRKLYGKTYAEDRENITRLGETRIRRIERFLETKGKLLDVGCAMGFFLDAARKRGWSVRGVEVSRFACEWGRRNLSLDIRTGSFLEAELEPGAYDVVTFFYVAEHFAEIEKVVEKARGALKKGGMLVFALPNRTGVSFRKNRRAYLERRPVDHFFDTSPKNLSRFLRKFDIIRKRIVVTGIHPERLFSRIERFGRFGRLVCLIYAFAANILRLGDTFEYYGIKK
jgi:2-polyprenyl-3-methyl-5-hydroxy-6-metoxy-1,4-benzoquinol methylase/spore coat polysaccharide biosynthesis predicted glycosyltransferase SpsG